MDELKELDAVLRTPVERYTSSYFDYQKPPIALYHYTTLAGMRGILESGKIWATDMSYLGDPEETVYGLSVTKRIADDINKTTISERPIFMNHNNLKSISISPFNYFFNNTIAQFSSATDSVFVACFCDQDDLLSQWRAYGAEGAGFELRLRLRALPSPALSFERAVYRLVKVHYDERRYSDTLSALLSEFFKLWLSAASHKRTIPQASDISEVFRKHLSAFVRLLTISYKRDGFREEKEWRMACDLDARHNLDKIKFRGTNKGLLVPYVELKIADPRRP